MRLHFLTQSCPRLFEGKLFLLSTTTSSPFIHAGLPASSFETATESRDALTGPHYGPSHFKDGHDHSLLNTAAFSL